MVDTTVQTGTRLDEIQLEPTGSDKLVVRSWPIGLRNPRPNFLSEEFADYETALKSRDVTP